MGKLEENSIESNLESKESTEVISDCYVELSKYVTRTRAYASAVDGMKAVYRRVIYAARNYNNLVKSASIVGDSIKYHPHGDSSVYDALVSMTCEFGQFPLFRGKGNFGGRGFSCAAMRYTEACLSDIARLMYLELIDYAEYIDGEAGLREPKYLPALLPYCLLVGTTSIPVGMPTPNIPPLNALDLVNYYIDTLEGRVPKIPLPDYGGIILDCSPNDVDSVIYSTVRSGSGKLWFRGLIVQEDDYKFSISSETPRCNFWKLVNKVQDWIDQDILDYSDETDGTSSRHVFTITNPSKLSPKQLKDRLERALKCSMSYSFIVENDERAVYCGLDYIIRKNLNYLRECTIRKYSDFSRKSNRQLQVLRAIEAYKNSGKIDLISKSTTKEIIDIIVKLGFEEVIAAEAVKKPISYLTKSHQSEIESLESDFKSYENYLNNPDSYLIKLYYKLRDLILPFYNSRDHSILLGDINNSKSKYANLDVENKRLLISEDDSGISWNHNLMLVSDDGAVTKRYVSSNLNAEIDLSGDSRDYKFISSDKGKYVVVILDNCISVKEIASISGSKTVFKLWEGLEITGLFTAKGDKVKLVSDKGETLIIDLNGWVKSRVSYPSRVFKSSIKVIEDAE